MKFCSDSFDDYDTKMEDVVDDGMNNLFLLVQSKPIKDLMDNGMELFV
jgi:hypothetical protein